MASAPSQIVPQELTLLTLNCWGLLYISALRKPRLLEIGRQIARHSPVPHIVCLQECWSHDDFAAIHSETADILPYAKFYHSGAFGGGLVILSRWPIEESTMTPYSLNGRPTAFWRGDWYVGKGIAHAAVRVGPGKNDLIDVYNTHTHAPYESGPKDSYICHRTSQAWQLSKLIRSSILKGRLTLALGDFNMLPHSLAHRIITATSPVRDVWHVLHPDSSVGPHAHPAEQARGLPCPRAAFNITENGATSDGVYNTWRWSKTRQKQLARGELCPVDDETEDPMGKRLDYIFASTGLGRGNDDTDNPEGTGWVVSDASVTMMQRHPTLNVSLSDHFGVCATLKRHQTSKQNLSSAAAAVEDPMLEKNTPPCSDYDTQLSFHKTYATGITAAMREEMMVMINRYRAREVWEQQWRGYHFYASLGVWVACLVAVWFSPRNFVSFILMLVSSLSLAAGVVNGLLALLFFSWELRGLKELEWEVLNSGQSSWETP